MSTPARAQTKNQSPNPQAKQRFGSHLSVAGGFENAFEKAIEVGCDCLQIFVKNQKQWQAKPLTADVIQRYKAAQRKTKIKPVVAHASYLINLASPKAELRAKSVRAVIDELQRCEALAIRGLVLHPGAHMGEGVDAGIRRIADGLDKAHDATRGFKAQVLLETTAGQGTSIGCEIEHLGAILSAVADPDRLGICLDTCHLFAAGYDIRKPEAYERTVALLKKHVSLKRIKCVHVNDSKGDCGSRIDRHDHIGAGKIKVAGFRNLLNDRRLARAIKVLETPKGVNDKGIEHDVINLRKLRRLINKT